MLKLGHIHYQHNDMSKSGNNILRMYVCMYGGFSWRWWNNRCWNTNLSYRRSVGVLHLSSNSIVLNKASGSHFTAVMSSSRSTVWQCGENGREQQEELWLVKSYYSHCDMNHWGSMVTNRQKKIARNLVRFQLIHAARLLNCPLKFTYLTPARD
jgi:hypothetical protein